MTGAMSFIDQVFDKLLSRGAASDWSADQLAHAIQRAMAGPPPPPPPIQVITPEALHSVPTNDMIHDMLRRGYAVMKIPADGKLKGLEDGQVDSG